MSTQSSSRETELQDQDAEDTAREQATNTLDQFYLGVDADKGMEAVKNIESIVNGAVAAAELAYDKDPFPGE